mgnify:CR=1 FL=1
MKKIIFFIIKYVIKIFSFLYNYKTSLNLKLIFNRFYSIWISFEFKKVGDNFNVLYPIYITGGKCIQFENCSIDQRLRIDAIQEFLGYNYDPEIIIGNNFSIQKDCHIAAINKIVIGNNVLIASKVFITDHMHGELSVNSIKTPPSGAGASPSAPPSDDRPQAPSVRRIAAESHLDLSTVKGTGRDGRG